MPIPNELFRPPVVSNSAEIAQVNAWAAGRDVPTLEELGHRTPSLKEVRRDEVRSPVADGHNVEPSKQATMNHLLRPPAFVPPAPAATSVKPGRPPIRGVAARIVPKSVPKK